MSAPEVDDAVPLAAGETVEWVGRPRWTVVLPAIIAGLLLTGFSLGIAWQSGVWPLLVGVPAALALVAGRELVRRSVQYVVTDRAVSIKRGVLGRRVTQVTLDTVQDSSIHQGVLGSMVGYGSVHVAVAGGADLVFDRIADPRRVRELVDQRLHRDSDDVPGSLADWRAVREELRAVRRALRAPR